MSDVRCLEIMETPLPNESVMIVLRGVCSLAKGHTGEHSSHAQLMYWLPGQRLP